MATRFWVGGTGNWGVTTTNWSATSGGASGASVPTSADDVVFDANSGAGTVTVTATANCANFTSTNFGGTFAGSFLLNVFGSMALGGTWTYSGTLTFGATATGKTINANGKTLAGPVTFDGVGGGWTLAAAFATTGAATLTNGAFSDGGFSFSALSFLSNNSNTRSVTKTANWTFSGSGSVITFATITGLTASFDTTKSWTLTGNTATATTVAFGSLTQSAGTLKVTAGTYALTLSGMSNAVGSVVDMDFTGFAGSLASATFSMSGNLTIGSGMAVTDGATTANFVGTGAMTLRTNGVQFNRNVTVNGTGTLTLLDALNTGTRIITHTQGGLSDGGFSVTTFSLTSSNANTRAFTKNGNWTLTGSGTIVNFTTTTNLTANFDNTKSWILAYSGAVAGSFGFGNLVAVGHLKVTAGTLLINLNTAAAATGTFNDIDFTGFSGTIGGQGVTLTGSLTYSATMASTSSGNAFTMIPPVGTTKTVTCNGTTYNRGLTVAGSGTVRLADVIDLGGRALTVSSGTLDVNSKNIAAGGLFMNGTGTAINAGGTTLTVNGTGTQVSMTSATSPVAYADMWSVIKMIDTSASLKTFNIAGGYHFKTVWFAPGAGGAELDVNGANTIDTLKCDATAACSIAFQESQTQTINALDMAPDATKIITFKSKTPGTQYTLQNGSGAVYSRDYMAAQDMIGLPGYSWFMGGHSSNLGNNLGVAFASPANASMMALEA